MHVPNGPRRRVRSGYVDNDRARRSILMASTPNHEEALRLLRARQVDVCVVQFSGLCDDIEVDWIDVTDVDGATVRDPAWLSDDTTDLLAQPIFETLGDDPEAGRIDGTLTYSVTLGCVTLAGEETAAAGFTYDL